MGPKKPPGPPPPPPPPEENYLNPDPDIIFVKESTMDEEMTQKAIDVSREALDAFNIEREIATHIKQTFEKQYGPHWQCIVGRNFGSYVSFEKYYIYFYLDKVAVLLYKNGDED